MKQIPGQISLFSAEASRDHANHLVLPGSNEARKMTATSGQKWLGLSRNSGPLGSLEKMLLESLEWHSPIFFLNWGGYGYRTRAFLIPACAVGARHRRYRVAIVGYSKHDGLSSAEKSRSIGTSSEWSKEGEKTASEPPRTSESRNCISMGRTENMENSGCSGCGESGNVCKQQRGTKSEWTGKAVADTESIRLQGNRPSGEQKCGTRFGTGESESGSALSYPIDGSRSVRRNGEFQTTKETGNGRSDFRGRTEEHEPGERRSVESVLGGMVDGSAYRMDGDLDFLINHYWDEEPDIPRIASGIANRVDRLKCLGNAVVPQAFYWIFKYIYEIEKGEY